MGRQRQSTLPGWVQSLITAGIRGLATPALLLGHDRATRVARALAARYPRISPSRFKRATDNLRHAFPDWPDEKIHATAVAAYQHLFQLGVEFAYAPRLITPAGFSRHLIFNEIAQGVVPLLKSGPVILITAHCGNWELIGYAVAMLGFPMHAVYRPLDLKPLDAWVRDARGRRGLTLLSKFGAMHTLPPVLKAGQPIGIVADQSGGDRGLFVPYFGRLTSTYKSIGLFAMHHRVTMICGVARRLNPDDPVPATAIGAPPPDAGLVPGDTGAPSMRYSVELTDVFGPADWETQPDPLFYLTARYRRAIELMVRSAPEQYFWMHRIWRSRPAHERQGKPFPPALREKLLALPWMTPRAVEELIETSRRDAAEIAAHSAA